MNRILYTILIAAVSIGITLAFVSGCSKKCVCTDEVSEETGTGMENSGDDETDADEIYNSNSANSSGNKNSGKVNTNERSSESKNKVPPTKYGDAETGGNVYSVGGVEPAAGSPGSPGNTDTTKTPKAKLRPARTTGLKTAADGQRN